MGIYSKMAFATSTPATEAEAIRAAYDFSAIRSLADIGGEGTLVPVLRRAQPRLQALVFDLESALGGTSPLCDDKPGSGRPDAFFAGIPADHDLYLLEGIISQWHDRAAVCILRNCRAAMGAQSRLLVIERIAAWPRATHSGEDRRVPEYRALLQAAGLDMTRFVPTASRLSVIEAVPRAA
jgi:C-methyltransferase